MLCYALQDSLGVKMASALQREPNAHSLPAPPAQPADQEARQFALAAGAAADSRRGSVQFDLDRKNQAWHSTA